MKTIEVNIPDEIIGFLGSVSSERGKFALKAIEEKIRRKKIQDLKPLLVKGYQATYDEDLTITKEFEAADLKSIRLY